VTDELCHDATRRFPLPFFGPAGQAALYVAPGSLLLRDGGAASQRAEIEAVAGHILGRRLSVLWGEPDSHSGESTGTIANPGAFAA
jgi:hypothetical protein